MKDLIINLFGTYTPLAGEGLASLDIPYILGVLLFAICLSSFFKLLGIILRG